MKLKITKVFTKYDDEIVEIHVPYFEPIKVDEWMSPIKEKILYPTKRKKGLEGATFVTYGEKRAKNKPM